MPDCILIGQTNVGKTLFALRFAAFLGLKEVAVTFRPSNGPDLKRNLPIDTAINTLTGPQPHLTRHIQSIELVLPKGKGKKTFSLLDTCGLINSIHQDPEIRRGMAQSLAAVRSAAVILHMIDAAFVGQHGSVDALGPIDLQVAQFAGTRHGYGILANKIDLPKADIGLRAIRTVFSRHPVFAVSALRGLGFKEVKQFVWRHI